jgi:hypothetical protein
MSSPARGAIHPFTVPDYPKLTSLEAAWVDFFNYRGLSADAIHESLCGSRNIGTIRNRMEGNAGRRAVGKLMKTRKNGYEASVAPAYPYTLDVRRPNDPTHQEFLSAGVDAEVGVDTGLEWDGAWSVEEDKYFTWLLAKYDALNDLVAKNDITVYYALYTPRPYATVYKRPGVARFRDKVLELMNDTEALNSPPECPYAFSYFDYVARGLSRREPQPDSRLFTYTGKYGGWSVRPQVQHPVRSLLTSLYVQGGTRENLTDLYESHSDSEALGNTARHEIYTAAKKFLDSYFAGGEKRSAAIQGATLTPYSAASATPAVGDSTLLCASQLNSNERPVIVFNGLDDEQYTIYPWVNINLISSKNRTSELEYISHLLATYPQRDVVTYVALYTPRKNLLGFTNLLSYTPSRILRTYKTSSECPYEVPFEAVYDPTIKRVRRYSELDEIQVTAGGTTPDVYPVVIGGTQEAVPATGDEFVQQVIDYSKAEPELTAKKQVSLPDEPPYMANVEPEPVPVVAPEPAELVYSIEDFSNDTGVPVSKILIRGYVTYYRDNRFKVSFKDTARFFEMEPAEAAKIMMGHFDNAEDTNLFYPFERVASMLGLPRDTGIDMLLNIADWDNSNNSRWLAGKEYHAKTLAEVASDKMKHLEFDEFAKRAGCSSSKLAWFIAQP